MTNPGRSRASASSVENFKANRQENLFEILPIVGGGIQDFPVNPIQRDHACPPLLPVAAKVRIRVDGAVGFQQGMPDHLFARVFVPKQLLHAGPTSIAASRARYYLFLDDLPLCGVCFVIFDQFTQRPHRDTWSPLFYRAAATTFFAAS